MVIRRAVVIASAAAMVGLAGCGGSGGAPTQGEGGQAGGGQHAQQSPVEAVQAAYATTKKADSAKFTIDQVTKTEGHTLHMTGHGASNFADKSSTVTMQAPAGQGTMHVRKVGKSVYMKLPKQQRGHMSDGKAWMSMDLTKMGMKSGQFGQRATTDPTRPLTYLRGVSKVTKVGADNVRGTKTTQYKAKINLDKVAKKMSGKAAHSIKRVEKLLSSHTLPMNLWLDKQGRVRQAKVNMRMHVKGQQVTSKTTSQYFDFGTPVNVASPSKDKTMPFSKMRDKMKQS